MFDFFLYDDITPDEFENAINLTFPRQRLSDYRICKNKF